MRQPQAACPGQSDAVQVAVRAARCVGRRTRCACVDDALAILLATRSPEIELLALTTVAGNVRVEVGTANAIELRRSAQPAPATHCRAPCFQRQCEVERGEDASGRNFAGGAYDVKLSLL